MKKIIIFVLLTVVIYIQFNKQTKQPGGAVEKTGYSENIIKYFEQENNPKKIAEYIIQENTSPNGFRPLPLAYSKIDGIFVYAPNGCPKNQQLKTKNLVEQLKAQNLPVTRSNSFHANAEFNKKPTDKELAVLEQQMRIVMDQPSPLVFINGKAKSNPSVTDVINEYNASK